MKFIYVVAYLNRMHTDLTPEAIRFHHTEVEADNDDQAYTYGQRWLGLPANRPKEDETFNDYIIYVGR